MAENRVKKIIHNFFRIVKTAIGLSLLLVVIALGVWFFMKAPKPHLYDIFFWVGAFPITLFSIGQFGDFFKKGNAFNQKKMQVEQQPTGKDIQENENGSTDMGIGDVSWVFAGLLLWLYSYFI